MQPLLDVRNISLRVPVLRAVDRNLLTNPVRFLSDLYLARSQRGFATLLEDLSFRLDPGERLGVIGANGAGKSTLLRLLAGIYAPTSGGITRNGTARGLFDISLGMMPDATGLENIYMRGLQMGLGIRQIRSIVPEVVEFADLGDDLERSLSTYSSGMRLRLAFSISTMIEPDILLMDEWIGTGDATFSRKVQNRMNALVTQSRGMVLATHNVGLMRQLCTKGLVLSKGRMSFHGRLDEALDHYQAEIRTELLTGMESTSTFAENGTGAMGLVDGFDLGPLGRCSQSSLSRWSRSANEADRAVAGLPNGSFSFHTDIAPESWWMIEWETPQRVDEIIVFNRVDAGRVGRNRIVGAVIEYSAPERPWEVIHTVDAPFGGIDGNPLRIATGGIVAEKIRIRQPRSETMHLDRLQFLQR